MPENTDPVLVILARVEAKLDNALEDIHGHDGRLDQHQKDIGSLRDRVTTLEASKPKNVSAWVACVIAGLGVIAAFTALFIN